MQRIARVYNNIQITETATFFEGSIRTHCWKIWNCCNTERTWVAVEIQLLKEAGMAVKWKLKITFKCEHWMNLNLKTTAWVEVKELKGGEDSV